MSTIKRYWVKLTCDHEIVLQYRLPRIGETLTCIACQGRRRVRSRWGIWHWRCRQCNSSNKSGTLSRIAMLKSATKHVVDKIHVVNIYCERFEDQAELKTLWPKVSEDSVLTAELRCDGRGDLRGTSVHPRGSQSL